ncbi:MAG TPA: GAF domain-containing protein, partial [Gammaproteobacteria bacterium]|nr:GAF domain-containing protein [Gammaproteobacteria bacterium]
VIAAMNSLALKATLGEGTGLLLQIVVPLALGIVLTRVRAFLDRIVERVFFRKKYLADKALRRFAKLSGRYEHADELLAAAVTNIRQHLGAPGVAIYERRGDGYSCIRQEGDVAYPPQARIDDTAFVAARADQDDIELAELDSALGTDGNVFPMAAHGELQAVLVCANLPGVRYPADERALLAHVAHQMGTALYVLRMEAKAKVVDALARAPSSALSELQAQARMLVTAVSLG